jgi:predicted dehydrogenase
MDGTNSERKVRVGVIGLGMGRAHIEGYKRCHNAQVVALCDVDAGRLQDAANRYDVRQTYTDAEEMLRNADVDAVSIALPNHLHSPITLAALNAGKHVLGEKPMAMTAAQAQEMVDAAHRLNRKLMIHFNFRFTPHAQILKRYVDSGELGRIYYAKTGWLRRRGIPGGGGWFTDRERSGGGPLIDLGVHRLDLALWLMGEPEPVWVMGSTYNEIAARVAAERGWVYTVEDLACGLIKLSNGATIFLEASWAGNSEKAEDMYTILLGTEGGAEQRNLGEGYEQGLRLYRQRHGAQEDITPKAFPSDLENPQQHFVRCILEDKQPDPSGEDGLRVQKILDALYQSAATGQPVHVA